MITLINENNTQRMNFSFPQILTKMTKHSLLLQGMNLISTDSDLFISYKPISNLLYNTVRHLFAIEDVEFFFKKLKN